MAQIAIDAGAVLWRCTRDPDREAEVRLLSSEVSLDETRATVSWPGAAAQADPVYGTLPLHTAVANGAPASNS